MLNPVLLEFADVVSENIVITQLRSACCIGIVCARNALSTIVVISVHVRGWWIVGHRKPRLESCSSRPTYCGDWLPRLPLESARESELITELHLSKETNS